MGDPRGRCRKCGAPIIWAVTEAGKPPPVDPKHLPIGWDGGRPLDCVVCGHPWPCEESSDQLYLKLKGAYENLCVAQMFCADPVDSRALQKALDGIAYVGAQLPNWSKFDMPVPVPIEDGAT